MGEIDVAQRIGEGLAIGIGSSLFLAALFVAGVYSRRRLERPKQIEVVRDHLIREFAWLAQLKDADRYSLAPHSWRRLLNTVNHLTGSLDTKERAALYDALGFLQDAHRTWAVPATLPLKWLQQQYHVVAGTIGPAFDLPVNPRWGSSAQAPPADRHD